MSDKKRILVVSGSIQHREVVDQAVAGVTHVLHLATSKETPESIMDVAIKGMFWLLEACRTRQASTDMGTLKGSPNPPAMGSDGGAVSAPRAFKQFILVGGDAGM